MTTSYKLSKTTQNRVVFFNTTPGLPETYNREKEISLPEEMDFDTFQSKVSTIFLQKYCAAVEDRCKADLYHCGSYKELGKYFSQALSIAPDDVAELISIYNNCSDSTQVEILFAVIHMVNKNVPNYNHKALSIVEKINNL